MSSTFSYHGEWPSDTFSLEGLNRVVDTHFGKKCSLVKITQGGYHKIYDILEKAEDGQPGESLRAVARVASPAFPRDKLLSEVATMQYIASYTSIPVPAVYEWCADASNEVGAEYMIMEKIPGTPAFNGWRDGGLTFNVKLNIVTQVAEYIAELFNLRFDSAGSLYFSSPDLLGRNTTEGSSSHTDRESYCVGPIVSTSFYCAVDGEPDYPSTELHKPGSGAHDGLHQFRGPFRRTSYFLSHQLRACLYKCERFPAETAREELGAECNDSREIALVTDKVQSALRKAIEFVELYPGEAPVCRVSDPNRPFTFWLEDFRLVNVMIDETTGKVNALLDFEGAMLVPTWRAARPPQWIPDPNGPAANWYGGTPAEQRRLWEAFNSTVNRHAPEWREAYEKGKAFRIVAEQSEMHWKVWAREDMVQWADEGIQWVKADPAHAGVPMPEVDPLAYLDEPDSPSL